jgi:ornithine carbamoyltransferase
LLTVTDDIPTGVRDADFLYTDIWVSMGEPEEVWAARIKLLLPYQVKAAMMHKTSLPTTKFMQCLPASHNTTTEVGARIAKQHGLPALEVKDEVFESPASIVVDQAENRMHTIKAVLVATLGD